MLRVIQKAIVINCMSNYDKMGLNLLVKVYSSKVYKKIATKIYLYLLLCQSKASQNRQTKCFRMKAFFMRWNIMSRMCILYFCQLIIQNELFYRSEIDSTSFCVLSPDNKRKRTKWHGTNEVSDALVKYLKYCRYGLRHQPINQSIYSVSYKIYFKIFLILLMYRQYIFKMKTSNVARMCVQSFYKCS